MPVPAAFSRLLDCVMANPSTVSSIAPRPSVHGKHVHLLAHSHRPIIFPPQSWPAKANLSKEFPVLCWGRRKDGMSIYFHSFSNVMIGITANRSEYSDLTERDIGRNVAMRLPVGGTEDGLFWGSTTIQPGKFGDAYSMTREHFHRLHNRGEYRKRAAGF